mmetsp:Transcript_41922/g.89493  ORF Transcript_41922/g.89493 Transcript_41922/m.89493 type:complete len:241 (-) Transcript_41922:426-1148(-)
MLDRRSGEVDARRHRSGLRRGRQVRPTHSRDAGFGNAAQLGKFAAAVGCECRRRWRHSGRCTATGLDSRVRAQLQEALRERALGPEDGPGHGRLPPDLPAGRGRAAPPRRAPSRLLREREPLDDGQCIGARAHRRDFCLRGSLHSVCRLYQLSCRALRPFPEEGASHPSSGRVHPGGGRDEARHCRVPLPQGLQSACGGCVSQLASGTGGSRMRPIIPTAAVYVYHRYCPPLPHRRRTWP